MRMFTAASHPRVTTFAVAFPGDGPLELPAGQWIIPPIDYSHADFALLMPEGTVVVLPRLDSDTLAALDAAIAGGGTALVDPYGAAGGLGRAGFALAAGRRCEPDTVLLARPCCRPRPAGLRPTMGIGSQRAGFRCGGGCLSLALPADRVARRRRGARPRRIQRPAGSRAGSVSRGGGGAGLARAVHPGAGDGRPARRRHGDRRAAESAA